MIKNINGKKLNLFIAIMLIAMFIASPTLAYGEQVETPAPTSNVTELIPTLMDDNEVVTLSISDKQMKKALDEGIKSATERGDNIINININSKSLTAATSLKYVISKNNILDLIKTRVNTLSIESYNVKVTFDTTCLNSINRLSEGNVMLKVNGFSSSTLPEEVYSQIGETLVYSLQLVDENDYILYKLNGGKIKVELTTNAEGIKNDILGITVNEYQQVNAMNDSKYENGITTFYLDNLAVVGLKQTSAKNAFTDIVGHWAYDGISYSVARNIFKGVSQSQFAPNNKITRGMFATVLGRLADASPEAYSVQSFSDVTLDKYYFGYVEWAYKNNITSGIGNGTFAPNNNITREQMAVMLHKYTQLIGFKLPKLQYEMVFNDSSEISSWAYESVIAVQRAGIMQGKENNNFDPKGLASRAEVSTVIQRLAELAQQNGKSIFVNPYVAE